MPGLVRLTLCAALVASPAVAAMRPLPASKAEYYAAGQTFAHCSAYWAMAAEVADKLGAKETSIAFGDTARGWKMAGMFFLGASMAEDRVAQTSELFDNLVAAKLQQLRSDAELQPDRPADQLAEQFRAECDEWVDTQKAVIEIYRRGPAP